MPFIIQQGAALAYSTFIGRDGQQAAFSWVTQQIAGVNAMVMVIDVGGAPASSTNPLPVTAPANLPVAVQGTPAVTVSGTAAVSIAATVPTSTAPDSAPVTRGGTTIGTTSTQLIASNGTRKRIDVSNWSTTAQIAVRFGASTGASAIGSDELLPPQAQATYYTTAALQVIASAAGTSISFVEW